MLCDPYADASIGSVPCLERWSCVIMEGIKRAASQDEKFSNIVRETCAVANSIGTMSFRMRGLKAPRTRSSW